MGKMNFRKSEGIYYISFENCVHEWNGHLEIFSLPLGNVRFSEQIFHRVPLLYELQSVAKVLGHSPFEVGFLTEFEKLPPPPQNNVANSEHTFPCLFQH